MIRRIAAAIAILLLLSIVAYCSTHITSGLDVDTANAVGKFVADGYAKFDDRRMVEKTDKGKIYYNRPGCDGNLELILYEVTTKEDMALVEDLARQALVAIPKANSIRINFYEAQNMHRSSGSGGWRGSEHLLKTIKISRASA
jgi:type III secretory pathway lipoprotein EscJ